LVEENKFSEIQSIKQWYQKTESISR